MRSQAVSGSSVEAKNTFFPDPGIVGWGVDHGELDAAFSSEVIEQLAPAAEHGLLSPPLC